MPHHSITHGLSKHPLYRIYFDIIKRCENKKSEAFPYYGAKGVYMCAEWRNNFKLFYQWALANGWMKGLHIDKDIIPKKLGIPAIIYSPEMCSVIPMKDNMNAMSSNVYVEYLGRTQTLSQWAAEFGVNYKMFWSRINRGFDFELALMRPKRNILETSSLNRKVILNTETGIFYYGAKEASATTGINTNTLHCKLLGRSKNDTPFIYV